MHAETKSTNGHGARCDRKAHARAPRAPRTQPRTQCAPQSDPREPQCTWFMQHTACHAAPATHGPPPRGPRPSAGTPWQYQPTNQPTNPLRKHQESQESDGQTGSRCLDKAVLVHKHNAQYQKNACPKNLPIPYPKHNSHNRALEHNVRANFSKFWRSSLPIRGIRSCGIEAVSCALCQPCASS